MNDSKATKDAEPVDSKHVVTMDLTPDGMIQSSCACGWRGRFCDPGLGVQVAVNEATAHWKNLESEGLSE